MKSLNLVTIVAIGLIAGFAATGCKKKPVRTTALPGTAVSGVNPDTSTKAPIDTGIPGGGEKSNPLVADKPTTDLSNLDGIPGSGRDITGRPQNRDKWKNQTVYFDFDRSVVKAGETPKVDTVAREFKDCDPESDLLIEGHCDERGTAEYNRALGERRAQALREYLVRAGINPERIHTVSFGKDKPVALGHDEASWSKNRRGEFILVLPMPK